MTTPAPQTTVPTSPTSEEVDFVVVGAGTGMLAALTAAEAGLKVLVVEKSEYVGGSTALSGGARDDPSPSVFHSPAG